MNGEEKYNDFIKSIDEWTKALGIIEVKPNKHVEDAVDLSRNDLLNLTNEECHALAYELICYSEYLDSVLAKQKAAYDWADDSIWYIIADKIDQYGDKYTKWQEKYYRAVKENPLTAQIVKIKNNAQSRMTILASKSSNMKRLSESLTNLGKRRTYG